MGNYTGSRAASLKEFLQKINEINIKSLEFHAQRGDFEKWIKEVLGDADLARDIKNLSGLNLSGENLRNRIYSVVSRKIRFFNYQSERD